ncbi:MAG: M23 family metallopeptidase [Stackebrandtia sp.]
MSTKTLTSRLRLGAIALIVTAALVATPMAVASADPATRDDTTQARPLFQMPFKCGQTWNGNTRTNHSPKLSVDFQGADINGQDVLASAPGKVAHIEDRGDTSYGKVVFLEHADGWFSTYAHLSSWTVAVGDPVDYGTKIGSVGTTGGSTGPHLHYEQRTGGYLGNVEEIHLNNEVIKYYGDQSHTSLNACDGSSPYTPEEVCGSGFSELEATELKDGDTVVGKVHLLANSAGDKCATTLKYTSVGQASAVAAYLEPEGGTRTEDTGDFKYYAGPVTQAAAGKCVSWGGSVGGVAFDGEPGHCD